MSVKELLENLMAEKAPGPTPSFTVFDLVKILEIIAETRMIGRGRLSEKLGLGKGATRTLLARLTDADLISTSKGGCSLTEKGRKVWKDIKTVLPQKAILRKNELTFAPYNVAALVRGRSENVKKGLEQRDAAVRAGSTGATTLIFRDDKLVLPTISRDIAEAYPRAFRHITSLMDLKDGDVVIIGCADQPREAEYGALAAAWTII